MPQGYLKFINTEETLADYLSMCNQLGMEPKIDGDSLKREHDIAARNVRNHRNKEMAEKFEKAKGLRETFYYEDEHFLVRGVRDYDDLIDEANQQHNCVASYAQNIIDGKSLIYFMRDKKKPDQSLITIELSPDCKFIRQKYLAYNRPIHDSEQSEFIEKWFKYCKDVYSGKIRPLTEVTIIEPEPNPPGITFDAEPDGQLSLFINGLFNGINGPEFAF